MSVIDKLVYARWSMGLQQKLLQSHSIATKSAAWDVEISIKAHKLTEGLCCVA